HRARNMSTSDRDPTIRRAWEYYSGGSYATNSYSKPGLILMTLKNYLGEEKMGEIMRTYLERWRFKHPKSQDFFDIINEVSGQDMSWFINQAFYSSAALDYTVAAVSTRETKSPRGYDFTTPVSEEDSLSADGEPGIARQSPDSSAASGSRDRMFESTVNVRRLGDFKMPVDIAVVFADGEIIREHWDGQGLWKKFRYLRPARLVSATVDPENKIPLDINLTNNSKTIKKQRLGVNKLTARLLFWMQFLMDQPEFMNLFTPVCALL
ncbi:MAG TPA: M1 family aminopeptidase, partial [bacterium]